MHETLCSVAGQRSVDNSIALLGGRLEKSLESGRLGGTRLWVNVALVGPDDAYFELAERLVAVRVPDPAGGKYDYKDIARKKRNRSVRLRMSCRDANTLGDTPLPDEVPYEGNVVLPLYPNSEWLLVVSVSGLDEDRDEEVAELIGRDILLRLPGLEYDLELVPWSEPVAAPVATPA
jgi:hypothetical protein